MNGDGRSTTPHFTGGGDREGSAGEAATRVARKLTQSHPDAPYDILWSAASFVIRDGRAPRDSVVLEEARRRYANVKRAAKRHQERTQRPAEDDRTGEPLRW